MHPRSLFISFNVDTYNLLLLNSCNIFINSYLQTGSYKILINIYFTCIPHLFGSKLPFLFNVNTTEKRVGLRVEGENFY